MTTFLMDLLAVVGNAYLLENEVSPSSVLRRDSESSSVAGECNKEVRERVKNSIDVDRDDDDDAVRKSGQSS